MNIPIPKPQYDNNVEYHHHAAVVGTMMLCEHTCSKHNDPIAHSIDDLHDMHNEMIALPEADRARAIAQAVMDEFQNHMAEGHIDNPVIAASIWHHLQLALDNCP